MAAVKRIEIDAHGPYRVVGDVPLKEMAPVHTFNGEPVAWHTLKEVPRDAGTYELCRCGASKTRPFCDRSHETIEVDWRETAKRTPLRERAREQVHGEEILVDDGSLCVDAGFCGTRTTTVWKLFAESDDQAQRENMREMVRRCPSGRIALFARADVSALEPDLPQEIAVTPGGPLWVRGNLPITASDGYAWEPRNRVTLCRCGASRNKPFCDGTHVDMHFDEH